MNECKKLYLTQSSRQTREYNSLLSRSCLIGPMRFLSKIKLQTVNRVIVFCLSEWSYYPTERSASCVLYLSVCLVLFLPQCSDNVPLLKWIRRGFGFSWICMFVFCGFYLCQAGGQHMQRTQIHMTREKNTPPYNRHTFRQTFTFL